jgi:enamine deaminase RidA (YjgF/YER057c/UK114 family)
MHIASGFIPSNHKQILDIMRTFISLILFVGLFGCTMENDEPQQENSALQKVDAEAQLAKLGIQLPDVSAPVANYVNAVRSGKLLFLAGKGPRKSDGTYITGKVGDDLTEAEGREAARLTAINQLAVLKAELGDLNKVNRIVKVTGMVNATPDFGNQPEVINGFSNLMVEVFGERGKHARAAVGMGSLPRNIAVEIDMIVEIDE